MNRLIAAGILIAVAIAISASEPTDDELAGWWESLTRDERLTELRKLDRVERATPELTTPRLTIVQLRDGTIHAFYTNTMTVRIAHLAYEITLPDASIAGERPRDIRPAFWGGFAAGALVVVVTLALLR